MNKLILILALFSIIATQHCYSQNEKKSTLTTNKHYLPIDSMHYLKEVKIFGISKVKIIPEQTLKGIELKKLNSHSVADALRYFAGLQIKDYGGIGGLKTVNIRSMGSQHVGVFYDGIQLGNAQNGVIDLGRFSLDNMESISLYNGQKSNIFQPAKDFSSASAIYMRTRTPKFKKQSNNSNNTDNNNNFKATFKTGSFGLANPSILWEHKFNKKLSLSVSSEYMYTTGKYKFSYSKKNGYDTTEIRKNGDVYALRTEIGAFGKIKDGEWRTKVYYYDSERGYPGASVREEPGKYSHQDRQWDTNFFIQGSYTKRYSNLYRTLLSFKYSFDYLHYLSDPRLDVTTMYINNHYYQNETYVSSANEFTISDWWSINFAIDYQFNTLNADLVNFVYPKRNTLLAALASSWAFDKLKFQASLLYTFVKENTNDKTITAPTKNEYTPTLVVSYKPFEDIDLNIRSFYKKIFRMPTLNDLYYTFIGNSQLKPEFTQQYDVGFGYTKDFKYKILKNFDFQFDAYLNYVDDKIVAMPTSNQFRWTMVNLGHVVIKGLEFKVKTNFDIRDININLGLNYTYQEARDKTDKESNYYGGQIPYIPWNSGSIILNGEYKGWRFNYSFIYTGERYESQANIPENYALPWYTSDFSISKKLAYKKYTINLTAEINNILNQQYEVVQCYPMPGTNLKFIMNINF